MCPDDVLVVVPPQIGDVLLVYQPGVGHNHEVFQFILADELLDDRHHGVSFVLVPFMDAVGQRIAVQAHQQPKYDLRVLVPALLREA